MRAPTSARERSPLGDAAAIYVQRGEPAGKQTTACLRYALSEHLPMRTIIPPQAMDQAVQMVKDRTVNVIIVAFDSKMARQLAVDVEEFGGLVVYVHPVATTIHPPKHSSVPAMDVLILRWYDAGRTPHEIAEELNADTTDVRAILRRGGRQPSR